MRGARQLLNARSCTSYKVLSEEIIMLKRTGVLLYGVISYAIFFATFLYAIGFVGNLLVPKSIDSAPLLPLASAIGVNILLLGVFALQHSIMARPALKKRWTRHMPRAMERSTCVLFSSLALIALFVFWQPMGGVIWEVQHPLGQAILYDLFALGWSRVLLATFFIHHFDLFGLRQVRLYFRGRDYTPLSFGTPGTQTA